MFNGTVAGGGFTARASGNINVREIAGDLKLVQGGGFDASVHSTAGNVTLATDNGSILAAHPSPDLWRESGSAPIRLSTRRRP